MFQEIALGLRELAVQLCLHVQGPLLRPSGLAIGLGNRSNCVLRGKGGIARSISVMNTTNAADFAISVFASPEKCAYQPISPAEIPR